MASHKKRLRSGFTTGACAAAAAKAAGLLLLGNKPGANVTIPFPDGQNRQFAVHRTEIFDHGQKCATASIIKDAGDDPDVTNGAEIIATVNITERYDYDRMRNNDAAETYGNLRLHYQAGEGVGTVTKPGLAIPSGQPAINPVPRQMIAAALAQIAWPTPPNQQITVEISIPNGRELADKTLNHRLGIVGGLSILGTTGIVRPISADAWTATIQASMSVARETGCQEIVLSTGRTSEKAAQHLLDLPVEAFAMMGDYLEFSLTAARENGFRRIHLAGMWAKIVKAALKIPQTHVRNGALEVQRAAELIGRLAHDQNLGQYLMDANTAREIYERLHTAKRHDLIRLVCLAAQDYAQETSGLPVSVYLAASPGKVIAHV
jgi:cobalt-precorrin-5B (C1)-methyltransferase